jgi:hypothetical protein
VETDDGGQPELMTGDVRVAPRRLPKLWVVARPTLGWTMGETETAVKARQE